MNTNLATDSSTQPTVSKNVLRDFIVLSKPRISVMVLLTVAVAGLISLPESASGLFSGNGLLSGNGALGKIIHAMFGLLLVSASGCALNQYLERYVDWMMPRTATRPLPDLRLTAIQVACFGAITFGAGVAWILALVNWQTASIAAGSWFLYVWVYTPLKLRTWLNTYVGAIAGAMPILIGSTAVCEGLITWSAMMLFAVLYIWQFPHFMAIAWLYRGDYASGNVKMASTVDDSGKLVGQHAIWFALLLIPVTVISFWPNGLVEIISVAVVLALGVWYLVASIRFAREVNNDNARHLFRVSLLYLPAYLIVLSVASMAA